MSEVCFAMPFNAVFINISVLKHIGLDFFNLNTILIRREFC